MIAIYNNVIFPFFRLVIQSDISPPSKVRRTPSMSSPGRFKASPPRARFVHRPSAPAGRGTSASAATSSAGASSTDTRRTPGLVVGLGDPVSDILVRLEDPDLAQRVFAKCGVEEPGGCLPVDSDQDIQRFLTACADEWVDGAGVPNETMDEESGSAWQPSYCPGGSAANVCKGIANLSAGCEATFVGMVGRDEVGKRYRSLLQAQNVRPVLLQCRGDDGGDDSKNNLSSAQCLSLVEKGGQRTMRTYLGASLQMGPGDFPVEEAFGSDPKLLHLEGYNLYRPELAKVAMRAAKQIGALVSLDLASFEVVRNCRVSLLEILNENLVDLLFANEDEALELLKGDDSDEANAFHERRAKSAESNSKDEKENTSKEFTRQDADDALRWMLRYCSVATVSLGARGCVSLDSQNNKGIAPGVRVPVVDTTGAGDSFTAGYLAAYLNGASPQACASCGCAVGTQAVQVLGAELTFQKWDELAVVVKDVVKLDRERASVGVEGIVVAQTVS